MSPSDERTERERHDLSSDRWDAWIAEVCGRLGVDPAMVDVPAIHDLTRVVAHRFERPMAPVSAYIVGVALGRALEGADAGDHAEALARFVAEVETTLPDGS